MHQITHRDASTDLKPLTDTAGSRQVALENNFEEDNLGDSSDEKKY